MNSNVFPLFWGKAVQDAIVEPYKFVKHTVARPRDSGIFFEREPALCEVDGDANRTSFKALSDILFALINKVVLKLLS